MEITIKHHQHSVPQRNFPIRSSKSDEKTGFVLLSDDDYGKISPQIMRTPTRLWHAGIVSRSVQKAKTFLSYLLLNLAVA